jgi:hypothetical protein
MNLACLHFQGKFFNDFSRASVRVRANKVSIGDSRCQVLHQDDIRNVRHDSDRYELRRIVVERFVEELVCRDRCGLRGKQRVAVRIGVEHRFGGDAAADAGLVFNDQRLAERRSHSIGDNPRDRVDAATSRHR